MLVTKRSWCDFYVWTPRNDDRVVERIYVDQSFITDIFTKLKKYYFCNMLPELASPRHLRGQEICEEVNLNYIS